MATKVNESLDFQSEARVLHLPAPLAADEPARLSDLNAAVAGLVFLDIIARAAATTNVNVASPGANIDGVALNNGDTVLLTGQTNNHENGLWKFNGAASALTRATIDGDAITYEAGTVVPVGPDGTSNHNSLWLQTTDNPVVGTTALTFTQIGVTLSAGTGITIVGTTVSLSTPVAVANGGTGSGTAAGARANLSVPGVYGTDFGDGAATSFAITHNLGNAYPIVVVYNKSTGQVEDCTVTSNSVNQLTLSAEAWTAAAPAANAYHVTVVG
jgi:hypothetical protein